MWWTENRLMQITTAALVIQAAHMNYKIFGPEFTFTGRMIEGEITIVDPSK